MALRWWRSNRGFATGAVVGYDFIYGKFLIGESIQHFRAGLNAGLSAERFNLVFAQSSEAYGTSFDFGLQGGFAVSHAVRSGLDAGPVLDRVGAPAGQSGFE